MPPASDFLCFAPLTANLNSLAASAFLFAWVSALTGGRRQKLLARQLWHLALADLIDAVLNTPWFALDCLNHFAGVGSEQSRTLDAWCQIGIANNVLFITSVLVEVHIALACFFGMWRLLRAQQVLAKLLPLSWIGGLFLGGAIAVLSDVSWDSGAGTCNTGSEDGHLLKAVTCTVALAICSAAYIATCFFSHRRTGHLAAERISRQTKVFLLAAIATWCPLMAYVYVSVATRGRLVPARQNFRGLAAYYLVYTFFFLNGFLNACAYASASRLMQQEIYARISNKPEPQQVPDSERSVSLVVAFQEDPEVLIIPGSGTREANFTAMLETAELARSQEWSSIESSRTSLSPAASFDEDGLELVGVGVPDAAKRAARRGTVAPSAQDAAAMLQDLHSESNGSVRERVSSASVDSEVMIISSSADFLGCFDEL